MIATAVHACSTTYTYDGQLLQTLGPAVIALGFALPRLAPLGAWADPVRVVLPWVGAVACGLPVGVDDGALGWGAGLCCVLAVQGGGSWLNEVGLKEYVKEPRPHIKQLARAPAGATTPGAPRR